MNWVDWGYGFFTGLFVMITFEIALVFCVAKLGEKLEDIDNII